MNKAFLIVGLVLSVFLLQGIWFEDVYALQMVAGKIEVKISPGETTTFRWGLLSDREDAPSNIELRAEGSGSEFLSFPESIQLQPKQLQFIDVTVSIPADHPNDVLLKPNLFALERGEEGGPTVLSVQMKKPVTIVIGNPVIEEEPEQAKIAEPTQPVCGPGTVLKDGICVPEQKPKVEEPKQEGFQITSEQEPKSSSGGGCLIATAAYGTEFAPQVQLLREIRDTKVYSTGTGSSFLIGFNYVYYAFSPTIADWERQNPTFKDAVRLFITPMLTSLSLMNLAEDGSELQVLGMGISIISLNVVLYVALPALVIVKLARRHE